MAQSGTTFLHYLKAFLGDWLARMCGPLSVPFTFLALWLHSLKALWVALAVVCLITASFRVWSKEREKQDDLKRQIAALERKPYTEDLRNTCESMLARLTGEGKELLRYLLKNEPLEVGRPFRTAVQIPTDHQDQQIAIAFGAGVVRHKDEHLGNGNLLRTNYVVAPQYRPVLEDLLYSRD